MPLLNTFSALLGKMWSKEPPNQSLILADLKVIYYMVDINAVEHSLFELRTHVPRGGGHVSRYIIRTGLKLAFLHDIAHSFLP